MKTCDVVDDVGMDVWESPRPLVFKKQTTKLAFGMNERLSFFNI